MERASVEILGLRGPIASFIDLPWCKGDDYYIQKLGLSAVV